MILRFRANLADSKSKTENSRQIMSETPDNYRRTPFPARPWITGKLYDTYAQPSILHCDAYVFMFGGQDYLVIEWREGGHKLVALDGWRVEPDGLTPCDYDAAVMLLRAGKRTYWTKANNVVMPGVHARVLAQVTEMLRLGAGRWARVVVQAHYVRTTEIDVELGERNTWEPPKPYRSRKGNGLPDIL